MTDLDTLTSLRERVIAAEGPGREIDALLWGLYDARPLVEVGDDWWGKQDPNDTVAYDGPPAFTGSIDLALGLVERVLPGCWAEGSLAKPARVYLHDKQVYEPIGEGEAPTPPLAILAALLSALIANAKGET